MTRNSVRSWFHARQDTNLNRATLGAFAGGSFWSVASLPIFLLTNSTALLVVSMSKGHPLDQNYVMTFVVILGILIGILFGATTRMCGGALAGSIVGAAAGWIGASVVIKSNIHESSTLYSSLFIVFSTIGTVVIAVFAGAAGGMLGGLITGASGIKPLPTNKTKIYFYVSVIVLLLLMGAMGSFCHVTLYFMSIIMLPLYNDKIFPENNINFSSFNTKAQNILREVAFALPAAIGAVIGQILGDWLGQSLFQRTGGVLLGAFLATFVQEIIVEKNLTTKAICSAIATVIVAAYQVFSLTIG